MKLEIEPKKDPRGGDHIVGTTNQGPHGKPVYHPAILHYALWGTLIGGILFGLFLYLLAEGILPIAGLGQLAAGGEAPATFLGAGFGIALGGVIGGLIGMRKLRM